ncbi:hypothetical protein lbkm_3435 [Lachnospiraceae bacterium KM106-2]|nr:hypothetical protein lbkm_3435 [Lachnospiraceae bacterium KM106-2]
MERDDIIIRSAIMHILDSTVGVPVLSESLLELGPDLNDLLRAHIYKIASSDDVKKCQFQQEVSTVYQLVQNFKEDQMIEISQQIASHLYTIMNANIEIPPADLLVVSYQVEGELSLALLKMNYKTSYVHYTESAEVGNCNDIIKQKATLPGESSRLAEAALINLSDYSILLVEKKYDVNGLKTNYFSQIFLECKTTLSSKAKLGIITKAVDQINRKYFKEDFDRKMETKSILHNEYAEQGSIQVENLCQKLYQDQPEIKEEFIEKLDKYNIVNEEVAPQNPTTTKKFGKQFLTTDSGIEINIPMDQYNAKENIEFLTNPDGSISIVIKNIHNIQSK